MKFDEMAYARPDIEQTEKTFKDLIRQFTDATSAAEQIRLMGLINEHRNDFQTAASLASVRHSLDTAHPFYEAEQEFFDANEPRIRDLTIQLYRALSTSPFRKELENKFGKQLFRLAEVSLKTFSPEVMDELKEENKLGTEYSKLVATAEVEFNGKKMTLSAVSAFMESTDRETREKAYRAYWGFFAAHEKQFDELFDKLVKVRTATAQKLGYKNFTELGYNRMLRTDYNSKDVAVFRDQIMQHVVPLAARLRERQRERIGVERLKIYDWSHHFNSGNPKPQGTPDEIIDNGLKMYAELSPETNEFFRFMVDNRLMDLLNKKGKAAGGYCAMFNKYKAPFIFANFNGTIGDVDVLTHEAGHAFQGYESRHFEVEEYYFPTYEACEIHSMSMEQITYPWMHLFFGADTEKYKYIHLCSNILFLPYGAAVDEFQHHIYENPGLTPAERRQLWLEMEKKYRPWVDYDGLDYLERGGYWQRQGHIYRSPFYYIDYCLAQVCAFQFWSRSRADFQSAWKDYLRLCKAGGSHSFLELVQLAGLRSPFEGGIFESLFKELETYLNGIDDRAM